MEENIERIEAYLEGALKGQELQQFEAELAANSQLATELEVHKKLRKYVAETEISRLKTEVNGWMAQEQPASTSPNLIKEKVIRPLWKSITTIAAVLAVAIGLGWWFYLMKAPAFDSQLAMEEVITEAPATQQGQAEARQQWVYAYQQKSYSKVIDLLSSKTDKTPEELYYLGLSYAALNRYDEASILLSSSALEESIYQEKAEWLNALILLKQGHKGEARDILEKIAKSESQYKSQAERAMP